MKSKIRALMVGVVALGVAGPVAFALAEDGSPSSDPLEAQVQISSTPAPAEMISQCEQKLAAGPDEACETFLKVQEKKRDGSLEPGIYTSDELDAILGAK